MLLSLSVWQFVTAAIEINAGFVMHSIRACVIPRNKLQTLHDRIKGRMLSFVVFLKICDEAIVRSWLYPTFRIVSYFCLKFHMLIHEHEILYSPVQHNINFVFFFNNTPDIIASYWIYMAS